MHRYRVFGLTLESDVPLDGLRTGSAGTDTQVRISAADRLASSVADDGRLVGSEGRAPCFVKWWCSAEGDRLTHACFGEYTVCRDESSRRYDVRYRATRESAEGTLRMDLLGRVLPLVLHREGVACLHAGAVQSETGAIVLVAPKGTGKSSMSAALIEQGATPLADDATALNVGQTLDVLPGVRSVRANPDIQALLGALDWQTRDGLDGKYRLQPPALRDDEHAPVPLAAIYVLNPCAPDSPQAATRRRLSSRDALATLVGQGKLASIMGGPEEAQEFRLMAAVAMRAPVFVLDVARDLGRLREAAEGVLGWHTPVSRATT